MNKYIATPVKVLTPLLLCMSLVYCNGGTQQILSNSSTSAEEALVDLDARLKKTENIKEQLNSIRRSLRPIESIFADIANTLDLQLADQEERAKDIAKEVVGDLRFILEEASRGVVENTENGWIIKRSLSLALGRPEAECQTSQVLVQGQRIDNFEQILISLQDCSSVEPLKLFSVKVFDDRLDVSFTPETLKHLARNDYQVDKCSIHITKQETQIHCEPMELSVGKVSMNINQLDILNFEFGLVAQAQMTLLNHNKKEIAAVGVTTLPGSKPQISIEIKE